MKWSTNLISSIKCNCCKWKYKYLSLSSNHGWSLLTKCVASWMRPDWTASRIRIRLSSELSGTSGSTPASAWNFSAASLNPSVGTNVTKESGCEKKTTKNVINSNQKQTYQSPNNSWSICSYQLVWTRSSLSVIAILLLWLALACHCCWK